MKSLLSSIIYRSCVFFLFYLHCIMCVPYLEFCWHSFFCIHQQQQQHQLKKSHCLEIMMRICHSIDHQDIRSLNFIYAIFIHSFIISSIHNIVEELCFYLCFHVFVFVCVFIMSFNDQFNTEEIGYHKILLYLPYYLSKYILWIVKLT